MKINLLTIVATLLALALPGCSSGSHSQANTTPSGPATKTIEITNSPPNQLTQDVTMAVGEVLRVTLDANHSTPLWWPADAQIGDTAVLQQTSHQYVAGNTTGGPGTEFWTFKALKTGATTITLQETNKAGSSTAALRTFTAKVTVQ